ncbi:hypothetical protein B0H10DRAFT_1785278, partial [Mycena sp. CBHHK59/15]
FSGMQKCYQQAYETAQILHRDISLDILMYHTQGCNFCGVLFDSDRARPAPRTGTNIFMTMDLHFPDPPRHPYRHDLESLYYALLFLARCFHNGREVEHHELGTWKSLGIPNLKVTKSALLLESLLVPQPILETS